MLKFFRKIRRKLLGEGSLRKYLVYAFGEILLIVIGILIALQLNNWHEGRKGRKLVRQYNQSLLRDMKDDLESIQIRIENARIRILGVERLLNFIDQEDDYSEYKKREDLIRAGWLNFFSPTLSTYNDLINSGNIKLIKDDSLKLLINDFINHNNRILLYEEHDKKNVWDEYGRYYRKWIDGRMNSAYLNQDSSGVLFYPLDWEGILSDQDFKRRLTLVLETDYGQMARYDRIKKKIEFFISYSERAKN